MILKSLPEQLLELPADVLIKNNFNFKKIVSAMRWVEEEQENDANRSNRKIDVRFMTAEKIIRYKTPQKKFNWTAKNGGCQKFSNKIDLKDWKY